MKKFYEAPKLTNHGTVSSITEASSLNGPDDLAFGRNGEVIGNLQGSLDGCAFVNDDNDDCAANF